jgi:hypothetical protein
MSSILGKRKMEQNYDIKYSVSFQFLISLRILNTFFDGNNISEKDHGRRHSDFMWLLRSYLTRKFRFDVNNMRFKTFQL